MLHVSDLIRAYEMGAARSEELAGTALNIGGGPDNTLSIWTEFGPMLEALAGRKIPVKHDVWRPGDQPVFIADIRKAERLMGWRPQVDPERGIRELYEWVAAHPSLFDE